MPGGGGSRNDNVGRVGEQGALDSIGDLVRQLSSSDIFGAEGRELFNVFEDLIGEFAGGYEDEGGGKCRRIGLDLRLASCERQNETSFHHTVFRFKMLDRTGKT